MKRLNSIFALLALLVLPLSAVAADQPAKSANPRVRMTTSLGVVEIELDARRARGTVANFLGYVDSGFYNGTIFHRVIPGFMIQGGGFGAGMQEKKTGVPIQNEADNGLKNVAGTIAMARTNDPHSASAQFFINTVDNASLDHRGKNPQGWGYAVFGKVTKGMGVVKKIEAVQTSNAGAHQNVPVKDVVITRMEVTKGMVDPAQEAAFERAAQSYRSAKVKPLLPEEAVKYKVQAELAVQQKRFDDAVDLYDQALGIAPWWPAGHYNRGLILGELQDYQGGIRALQKYLKLEPGASNARAVQLKIYQWESLVPRAAK